MEAVVDDTINGPHRTWLRRSTMCACRAQTVCASALSTRRKNTMQATF